MSHRISFYLAFVIFWQAAWAFTVTDPRSTKGPIKAIAFDAFPIFDPRPLGALAIELYPEKGHELMKLWRARQFEYQWLRALGGKYADFRIVTEDALEFAARQLGLPLTVQERARLMTGYDNLTVWPDAKEALSLLKGRGYKVVFLSNMTEKMLRSGVEANGLEGLIDEIFSTDSRKTFKPSPEGYRIGVESLGLPRDQILFVAFAGWDVAGAKWFGYPTFWVNRAGAAVEELGAEPDGMGKDLNSLVLFLDNSKQ